MITEEKTSAMVAEQFTAKLDLAVVSDADLLDAWHHDQSRESLATLLQRYGVMVLSVCRRRCRSHPDAEDAFQTTFLYMARNAHKIRHPERLPGWLHRVAQRAASATLSIKQREIQSTLEAPAALDDPLERLTRRHEAIVLDEELADLPEHYRAALVMHILEGHSLALMADQFGTTIGTIRGRLQRGKQLLAQRLRRRGVVPVIAFTSAAYCSVPAASAATVGDSFIQSFDSASLPESPIAPSALEPLLNEGFQLMKMPFVSSAVAVSTLMIGLLVFGSLGATVIPADDGPLVLFQAPESTNEAAQANVSVNSASASASTGTAPTPSPSAGVVWQDKVVQPTPDSQIASEASEAMQNVFVWEGSVTLQDFPARLTDIIGVPVWLDGRAVEFAKLDPTTESIELDGPEVPLATSLYRFLHPLGLKAVVRNEGIVITADKVELARKGIGASQWVNVNEQAADRIEMALEQVTTVEMNDETLANAIATLGEQHGIRIVIDAKALEEIGLTEDSPVTVNLADTKLRTVLEAILSDLDLTLTIQREVLKVTTHDAAEGKLLTRIYSLAGTGFPQNNFDHAISLIQATMSPDTWESLGGPSTMSPMENGDGGSLVVATTYKVHHEIEELLSKLRESSFSDDPILERIQVQKSQLQGGGGMGGGGMGFGGMGGGGMGGSGGYN